jgi:PKD repeat protein
MAKVLKADCSAGDAYVEKDFGSPLASFWLQFDIYIPTATFTAIATAQFSAELFHSVTDGIFLTGWSTSGASHPFSFGNKNYWNDVAATNPVNGSFTADAWHTLELHYDGTNVTWKADGSTLFTGTNPGFSLDAAKFGGVFRAGFSGEIYYIDNVKIGTTEGASDIFSDNFESGTLAAWDSTHGSVSVVNDPSGPAAPVASFTVSPSSGDIPLAVSFTDTSTPGGSGPITAWAWNFGDGSTSTLQNPTHTFTNGGRYTVTLTVTGTSPDGTDTTTDVVAPSAGHGRVLIAFDDGPLVADPAWTRIDGGDAPFPDNFVSGYDVQYGRQTLLSQTDTGTATVYINDYKEALFDPRNVSSPYHGKLDGRQIRLQLWDPVAMAWEDQFRGLIDDITWDIDGSAVGADGEPINASIQLDCVDMFDFLAGYGLTPGLDGVTPPAGAEDGVYYAATVAGVDDRFIEILADVGIDPSRYLIAAGNVHVKAVKYDPDESALQALRDAADAEMPFIANIYCDRHGMFLFRGRYSRFDPDDAAAEPGSDWDFTRWAVGDGAAITADPARAQMRILSFGRNRSDLINVAVAYPQDLKPADMPGQVFADTTSITDYGKHAAPPMSDLLTNGGTVDGNDDKTECFLFAKLLVKNQKDPRESITALQVKAIRPDDPRAAVTWALLTRADVSHILNVSVGYPSGTGLAGDSPEDDYYIEGRRLQVRPLNPTHDYAECDYDLSPAVWSMDTHSVFLPFPGTP